jgi:hypothetical protein
MKSRAAEGTPRSPPSELQNAPIGVCTNEKVTGTWLRADCLLLRFADGFIGVRLLQNTEGLLLFTLIAEQAFAVELILNAG